MALSISALTVLSTYIEILQQPGIKEETFARSLTLSSYGKTSPFYRRMVTMLFKVSMFLDIKRVKFFKLNICNPEV